MRFTRAIVRPPAATFAAGITSSGLGPPDLALALEQHDAYCRTLERLGLALVRLAPIPTFPTPPSSRMPPSSPAGVRSSPARAPRAAPERWRRSERCSREWFPELAEITAPGTVDGGDLCEAGEHFFIGLSQRTNPEGAAQLAEWLARHGFSSSVIDIRAMPGLLHLKTGLSWLGERRLLAAGEIAGHRGAARVGDRSGAGRARTTPPTASG